jgi:hypothetical protein
MAVIKDTANDGVVVASADAVLATVQCAVVRTSILRTMDETPVDWLVQAGPTVFCLNGGKNSVCVPVDSTGTHCRSDETTCRNCAVNLF